MTNKSSHLRSPMAKARGLGSAKDGTHHWWMQRLTALLLIPTSLWFVTVIICSLMGAERYEVAQWFASPFATAMMLLLVSALFYHSSLGLQVIIEDYVHKACCKNFLLISMKLGSAALLVISWMAILKLHIVGI